MIYFYFISPQITWAFYALAALISGIFFHTFYSSPILIYSGILLAILTLIGYVFVPRYKYSLLIILIFFIGGMGRTFLMHSTYFSNQAIFKGYHKQLLVCLEDAQTTQNLQYPYLYTFSLYNPSFLLTTFVTPYYIQFYTKQKINAQIGNILEIKNISCKTPTNLEYQKYLFKEGILFTGFTSYLSYRLIIPSCGIYHTIARIRNTALEEFKYKISPSTFALFSPLFLGNKAVVSKEYYSPLKQNFKYWGIIHYLARSGMHVILFVTLYSMFFNILPFPLIYKQIIMTLFLWFYMLFSWNSISFLRAFTTYNLTKLCFFNGIPALSLHIVCLTCILTLCVNPLQLFFLDFQLSFFLTFCLAWFITHFKKTIV